MLLILAARRALRQHPTGDGRAATGNPHDANRVRDAVGAGFVAASARPGGTITGFTNSRGRAGGQMAADAQRDRAPCQTGGNHVQPRHGARWRSILGPFEAAARSLAEVVVPLAFSLRITSHPAALSAWI